MKKIVDLVSELEGGAISNQQLAAIEIFISKGLSTIELQEALLKSYNNNSIDKPWNYFCAICWRIIKRTERGSEGESVGCFGKFPWS